MTLQEIFDRAVGGVLKQGGPSIDADGKCRYRLGARKCAAGQLIPDDEYCESMEGQSALILLDSFSAIVINAEGAMSLIDDLQDAHDSCAMSCMNDDPNWLWRCDYDDIFLEKFKFKMQQVALSYCLSTDILK